MALVKTRKVNAVLEIVLNRPDKKNALTTEMYQELTKAFQSAKLDKEIHVIMLCGQPHCFCAGNDLGDFMNNPPEDEESPVFRFLSTVCDFPKPLVCAINGPAIGIGTTICLHSDLVYSGESANFQTPFVKLGLVPEFASSYLMPLRSGHVKAFEILVKGETFDARTAKELGLVNEIFSDENYLTAALQKAQELAALPPEAVMASKRLLKENYMPRALQALGHEANEFIKRLKSDEAQQAIGSFFN